MMGPVTFDESGEDLVDVLHAVLPPGHAVSPVPVGERTDWFGRTGYADILVRPGSTPDVATVLRAASDAGAVVVPVGGNTGLVGGTLGPAAVDGDSSRTPSRTVLLSLASLTDIDVDPGTGTAVVGAGVTIADLHAAAEAHGLTYGVDLASRDSATIGGTIATNAGGIHVCAYGVTRAQVLGLEVVLADGAVITDLAGLPKDNTGYSLKDLFVGSEGTLGVVTRARVRLHPAPRRRLLVVAAVDSLSQCVAVGRDLGRHATLLACESVDADSWRAAATDLDVRDPLPGAGGRHRVLVELDIAGRRPDEALSDMAEVLAGLPDVAIGEDDADRAALWRLREGQAEWWNIVAAGGGELHKFDVTLPLADLDASAAALAALFDTTPGVLRWGIFGHVYEGSLHIQLTAAPDLGEPDLAEPDLEEPDLEEPDPEERVLRLVSDAGGSLSSEHGVGRDKASLLGLRRSDAELAAMRAIKTALDPRGVLNPGVILPG